MTSLWDVPDEIPYDGLMLHAADGYSGPIPLTIFYSKSIFDVTIIFLIINWSLQNFAQLSWHVQKFVAMSPPGFWLRHKILLVQFEFCVEWYECDGSMEGDAG